MSKLLPRRSYCLNSVNDLNMYSSYCESLSEIRCSSDPSGILKDSGGGCWWATPSSWVFSSPSLHMAATCGHSVAGNLTRWHLQVDTENSWLVGGLEHLLFSHLLGTVIQLTNIFQKGRYTTNQLKVDGVWCWVQCNTSCRWSSHQLLSTQPMRYPHDYGNPHIGMVYTGLPSGKHTKNYGTSPVSMSQRTTISILTWNYQRLSAFKASAVRSCQGVGASRSFYYQTSAIFPYLLLAPSYFKGASFHGEKNPLKS